MNEAADHHVDTTPLHHRFGVEVHDLDLRDVTATGGYRRIRELFEAHSLLLFRDQTLDDEAQIRFAKLFGPIERPFPGALGAGSERYLATNRRDDGRLYTLDDFDLQQNLANQFWHTDSSYRSTPALVNVLSARVVPSAGGETEFVSTRSAWRALDPSLQAELREAVVLHSYAWSRAMVSGELAEAPEVACIAPARWRAVWPNPCHGHEALYIASHAFGIEGMEPIEAQALIADLLEQATRRDGVYCHAWRPGDVIVWDERAMMHRGRPWPLDEERTLIATVISARRADGLDLVRPPIPTSYTDRP